MTAHVSASDWVYEWRISPPVPNGVRERKKDADHEKHSEDVKKNTAVSKPCSGITAFAKNSVTSDSSVDRNGSAARYLAPVSASSRFIARGGIPSTRRMCRAMWLWCAKPVAAAISAIDSESFVSSPFARSTRRWITY
jgi:hypothetical protein